ncbi:hypothetical protein CQS04_12405 [Chryseomicrobium excrementi]|uniref:Uncharacterized protein n=1 Tax=Chryseomicrobium excrementi TaxID=2041346 RepID=A0A2M9EXW2_9BACL|nr:hypothetical protein [Chryseomicrobium excrementi]PJK16028.1 hypothetical protein CQS04_12405 [Chryseomicrobium excrementi]
MFSDEQLQAMIDGKIVGEKFPYDTNDEREIEAHIRRLFHRINRIPNVVCEAEWNHFGSGYASFVEFFCYQKEDLIVLEEKHGHREIKMNGLIVDISRLASVAIMGDDEQYKTIHIESNEYRGGAYGSFLGGTKLIGVSERFQTFGEQLKQVLEEFDFEVVEPEEMNQLLSFKTKIPTIYRESRDYTVADAIFYWED